MSLFINMTAIVVSAITFSIMLLLYWIFIPLAMDLIVQLTELIRAHADIAKGTL